MDNNVNHASHFQKKVISSSIVIMMIQLRNKYTTDLCEVELWTKCSPAHIRPTNILRPEHSTHYVQITRHHVTTVAACKRKQNHENLCLETDIINLKKKKQLFTCSESVHF